MNKTELIVAIAEQTQMSKKDAEKALTAFVDIVTDRVASGEEVRIVGFGSFELRSRESRVGCNPRTKEAMEIPASNIPAFRAGKVFKEAVNK